MNLSKLAIFASMAVCPWLAAPDASALSGGDLYKFCLASSKASEQETACLSYIRGFVDGMLMGVASEKYSAYCPPNSGVPMQQALLIVERYLREHPEKLHEEAGFVVGGALIEAFPCANIHR